MRKILAIFSLILAVSSFAAAADVYVKSNVHADAISLAGQDQPARDTVTEQWIGDGKVASISAATSTIVDPNKGLMRIINNKTKTYVETALPLDFAKLLPAQLSGMLQGMKTTATVTATGNKKTFGARSCDEYIVNLNLMMMPMTLRVFATTDVPFDYKNYAEKIQSSLMKSQMIGIDDASIGELGKIKGFWIAQEMTGEIMGAKIHQSTEVVEISSKPAPEGIYEVPSGYTKQDSLSMQDLQQGR
jgi:hypothetical protein